MVAARTEEAAPIADVAQPVGPQAAVTWRWTRLDVILVHCERHRQASLIVDYAVDIYSD